MAKGAPATGDRFTERSPNGVMGMPYSFLAKTAIVGRTCNWAVPLVGTIVSNAAIAGTTGITVTPHSGTITGDLMIAIILDTLQPTVDTITGWTLLFTVRDGNGVPDRTQSVYGKYATQDAPGATTFTNNSAVADEMLGFILTFNGGHASTMLDVAWNETLHKKSDFNTPSPNDIAHQPITTNSTGAYVLLLHRVGLAGMTSTAVPTGYTKLASNIGESERQFILAGKIVNPLGVETPDVALWTSTDAGQDCTLITFALKPIDGACGGGNVYDFQVTFRRRRRA